MFLKKILDFFKKYKVGNSTKDCQGQPKTTINEARNVSHNEIRPVTPVSRHFDVIIAGVSFYQKALEKICGGRPGEGTGVLAEAKIIPYDDNPYDAYAVKIEIEGEIIGHLSRKDARKWRSKMISECLSNSETCPAKIVWDKGAFEAGSYGVRLDTNLTLLDSIPERNNVHAVSVPTKQPNQIEFLVNELNRFELSNCGVGDGVNLWVADQTNQIFIYRQGVDFGEGKLGVCPDGFFDSISAAPGCEASIANIYEGGCKIVCRFLSKAEMDERKRQVKADEERQLQEKRQKLSDELDKKYAPKKSIKAVSDIKRGKKLIKGEKIYLDIKDKEYYLSSPSQLHMDLLNRKKTIIGRIATADIIIRILKAHYNGYQLEANVVSFIEHTYYPRAEIEIVPKK